MKKLYIADLHFFHENILWFDSRPFRNIKEMTEKLVENWNGAVEKCDHVYVLGDMFWRNSQEAIKIMRRLNGNIHLINGNHDRIKSSEYKKCFCEIVDYKKMTDIVGGKKRPVIMSHYYIPFYDTHYRNGILLHGHTHMSKEAEYERWITKEIISKGFPAEIYNVGCMYPYMDYTPRTLDEIVKRYKDWSVNDK